MKRNLWVLVTAALVAVAAQSACKGGGPDTPEPPSSGLSLKGTITAGGSALAGVTVYLSWDEQKTAVTDANGRFSFTGLTKTRYVVTPALRNQAFTPSNYELSGSSSRTDL